MLDVVIHREGVRAVLLSEDQHVLLFRMLDDEGNVFWIPPGGGIEPEENPEQAMHRELREEVGLSTAAIGPVLSGQA
ncbi:NUDIX domain-containing protein [Rhizobium laguerreae]|nr:NUDIX domain-containing protein [Rhizobium laguerreae]